MGTLKQAFPIPFGWDTDVNAAALGEATWGAAKWLDSCVYYTIGTGIGVGVLGEGKLVHGLVHPEGGHTPVRRHSDDSFVGNCIYHGNCLEGMAAGPAIEKRWHMKGSEMHHESSCVGNGSILYSPFDYISHSFAFTQKDHSRRRSYASRAALSTNTNRGSI